MHSRISPRKMVKNKSDLKASPHRNRRRSFPKSKSTNTTSSRATSNVKVIIRVRPLNQKEVDSNYRSVVHIAEKNVIIFDPKENDEPFFYHGVQQRNRDVLKKANKNVQFIFDRVFGYDSNNMDIFADSTKSLLNSLMDGYNCSVFVYGATGAGKTHTMLGNSENPGITILTMKALFDEMKRLNDEREFELGMTYLEVYNETVKDLLNPGALLHLREDGKFGVCVAGIKFHRIMNPDELFSLLEKGNGNRTQHPTDANAESSRSHAVFQVYVNMLNRVTSERRISKLSMIDLAGSERGAATGCSGMRFTEGANINKSLLALGNCINSLADGHQHVPYRDSKLTRLLKDSLGGNCQTVMIANISPSHFNYEDTYNTLKYATRAKSIKSNMKKNVVNQHLTISQYVKLVEELNKKIETLQAQSQLEATSTSCQNQNDRPIINDPTWCAQLQELLKERLKLHKQHKRLSFSEEFLECRVKCKESAEIFISDLCDTELLESIHKRTLQSVGIYQRQLKSILSEMNIIQQQQHDLGLQITALLEKENISEDSNVAMLQNEIDMRDAEKHLMRSHTAKLTELLRNESEHKDKVVKRIGGMLRHYHLLLRGHGHITNDLADDYRSVIRMTQGLRSVTWQMDDVENVPDITNKDSGIDVTDSASHSVTKLAIINNEETPLKRPTPSKRKLYETEISSSSILKNNFDGLESNDTASLKIVDAPCSTINTDILNNTFNLYDKEHVVPKKKTFSQHTNEISAEYLLAKVPRHEPKKPIKIGNNTKPFNKMTKLQRFPLRNRDQDPAKLSRTVKTPTSTRRVNTAPVQRL